MEDPFEGALTSMTLISSVEMPRNLKRCGTISRAFEEEEEEEEEEGEGVGFVAALDEACDAWCVAPPRACVLLLLKFPRDS